MTGATDVADSEGDVIVRREGNAGIIRLNRPKAINALTLDMVRIIAAALDRFERDPAIALVLLEGQASAAFARAAIFAVSMRVRVPRAISARSSGAKNMS